MCSPPKSRCMQKKIFTWHCCLSCHHFCHLPHPKLQMNMPSTLSILLKICNRFLDDRPKKQGCVLTHHVCNIEYDTHTYTHTKRWQGKLRLRTSYIHIKMLLSVMATSMWGDRILIFPFTLPIYNSSHPSACSISLISFSRYFTPATFHFFDIIKDLRRFACLFFKSFCDPGKLTNSLKHISMQTSMS